MTEILDLYNENGEPTGGTVLRGTPVPHGYYLMLVSIMTVRSDGRFLITKRAPEKNYAGRWEITGGCVQSGETAAEGALRELREETGITLRRRAHCASCGRRPASLLRRRSCPTAAAAGAAAISTGFSEYIRTFPRIRSFCSRVRPTPTAG